MLNLVNITKVRNNLSQLVDQVVKKRKPIIVIRESTPQVVMIPYEDYKKKQRTYTRKRKKTPKLPYGMFSLAEISEKEIDEITSSWDKTVNALL